VFRVERFRGSGFSAVAGLKSGQFNHQETVPFCVVSYQVSEDRGQMSRLCSLGYDAAVAAFVVVLVLVIVLRIL
jgi:hypothetical protein